MPCLLGCLALAFPRIVIILVVIFSDYIGTACETTIWPLLGFFVMPLTTLAHAWAWHSNDGSISGIHLVVVVVAALIDLGIIGGNASNKQVREYAQRR